MAASPGFRDHVLELLAALGPVTARAMFGGYGLYLDGRMFALISDDTLYLKADDRNRAAFEAAGTGAFRPRVGGRRMTMPYYETPPEILEDGDALADWARGSVAVAADSPVPPKAKTRAGSRRTDRRGGRRST
jgi:DNA transformation protein